MKYQSNESNACPSRFCAIFAVAESVLRLSSRKNRKGIDSRSTGLRLLTISAVQSSVEQSNESNALETIFLSIIENKIVSLQTETSKVLAPNY